MKKIVLMTIGLMISLSSMAYSGESVRKIDFEEAFFMMYSLRGLDEIRVEFIYDTCNDEGATNYYIHEWDLLEAVESKASLLDIKISKDTLDKIPRMVIEVASYYYQVNNEFFKSIVFMRLSIFQEAMLTRDTIQIIYPETWFTGGYADDPNAIRHADSELDIKLFVKKQALIHLNSLLDDFLSNHKAVNKSTEKIIEEISLDKN